MVKEIAQEDLNKDGMATWDKNRIILVSSDIQPEELETLNSPVLIEF